MERKLIYQKLEAHYIELIATTTKDSIIDPFLAIGTTAVVAKKLGRKYFELKRKKYFAAAVERIKNKNN